MLINKLDSLGVGGTALKWFQSYLGSKEIKSIDDCVKLQESIEKTKQSPHKTMDWKYELYKTHDDSHPTQLPYWIESHGRHDLNIFFAVSIKVFFLFYKEQKRHEWT